MDLINFCLVRKIAETKLIAWLMLKLWSCAGLRGFNIN